MEKGFSWSNIAVGMSTFPSLSFNATLKLELQLGRSVLIVGATMNMFEVTTLGQPLEVIKTQMAANRSQTMQQAFSTIWGRGGIKGFYQGLIPWVCAHSIHPYIVASLQLGSYSTRMLTHQAWIEASTKGAVLIFTSAEIEKYSKKAFGLSPAGAGMVGGIGGGIAQAYATMGESSAPAS